MKPYVSNEAARKKLMTSEYGAVLTDDDLDAEMKKRRSKLVFPLHIMPPPIQPFVNAILSEMQGERSFVGLSILQAASTAIGTALRAESGGWQVCLSMWGCLVGISSSGKSMTQGMVLRPLFQIQDDYDKRYREALEEREYFGDKDAPMPTAKVLIYSDITYEALTRDILGHNFKGVTSYHDELLKWLGDMGRYDKGKGASEQSFYTASWSPSKAFSMRRANGKMLFIDQKHLVVSVIGTTQPGMVFKFYQDLRLESGYIFRMLWAFPESDRVISPKIGYRMSEEVQKPYADMLTRLYQELPMDSHKKEPTVWALERKGEELFQTWQDNWTVIINKLDTEDKNIKGGIFGKIKEYVTRLSCILKAMHLAASGDPLAGVSQIEDYYVEMAIEAANYFMASGWEAYQLARNKIVVPIEVIQFHAECKACGFNYAEVGRKNMVSKQAIKAKWDRYASKYPHLFSKD